MKSAASAASRFRPPRGTGTALVALAALGGIGYGASHSIYSVKGGERAVMFSRYSGISDRVIGEGTHFMVPWLHRPIIFDIRTRPRVIKSLTGSKDLQMVSISLRVLTRPDPEALPEIYRTLGTDYDDRVLPSIVNEVLKSVVAQFNASSLLTNREAVSSRITRNLMERAREFDLVLEDVSITELQFGKEFTAAVEAKQVAQQDAERARFIVQRALQEKKSIIIQAEGESKSAEMIGRAIQNNPSFVALRRIEAAREVAETLSKSHNQLYLSADSLMLNLMDDLSDVSAAKKA